MDGPTMADSVVTSSFQFPEEFAGFQGHFPTTKVLPGACQIQCVLSTVAKALEKRVVLKQVMLAKYFAPVFPGEKITCNVSGVSDAGAECICKTRITRGEEKIADMKLQISLSEAV